MQLLLLLPLIALGVTSVGAPSVPTAAGPRRPTAAATPAGTAPAEERLRAAVSPGRWSWPWSPRPGVVRPFTPPSTVYGPGHRGVDLAGMSADRPGAGAGGGAGQVVRAVDAGTVTHVGRIAGRGTVTVLHPSGVRSTYEPVAATVRRGQVVSRGSALGRLEATGAHCPAGCLHLGALRGPRYLDPMLFLVGGRPVRLLPLAPALPLAHGLPLAPGPPLVRALPVAQAPDG